MSDASRTTFILYILSPLITILLITIALLLLGFVGALLSASETAITASSKARIYRLLKSRPDDKRLQSVTRLQQRMTHVITSVLLVNTWAITAMTTLCTMFLTQNCSPAVSFYITTLMSIAITIYVELAPKIFVYGQAERVICILAPMLEYVVWILKPIVIIVDRVAIWSLKRIRPAQGHHDKQSAQEDLYSAIDWHHLQEGQSYEAGMLKSVLNLKSVMVADVMIHRHHIAAFCLEETRIVEQILELPYTRIPIWQDAPDNIVGIVHQRDVVREQQRKNAPLDTEDLRKIMTKPWFVPETVHLFAQLEAFRKRREHLALVVDEYGSFVGIITLEDVLEEIVGDILDEHDEFSGIKISAHKNTYLVPGHTKIRDLNKLYTWNLDETGPTTLAGLFMKTARAFPKIGTKVLFKQCRMSAVRIKNNHIMTIAVTPFNP